MLLYSHVLHVHTESATLYLRGILREADVAVARATCAQLPTSIRLLRVDVRGVDVMDAAVREGIATLAREWRSTRLGHVIVAASLEKVGGWTPESEPRVHASDVGPVEAALLATYL
jgi:hypothetical protein